MNSEILSKFLEVLVASVITVAVPALVTLLAVWVRQKTAQIKSKLPADVLWHITEVAGLVVAAAEQTGMKDALLAEGKAKKEWAMEQGELILKNTLGLSLDLNKLGDVFWAAVVQGLNAGIEQKVLEQNQAEQATTTLRASPA
jgi:hypothetical protein